jgi:hypothetical protein
MLETIVNITLSVLLEESLKWFLKSEICKRFTLFCKMQMLVLYLDWVLVKTPLQVKSDDLYSSIYPGSK